MKLIHQGWQLVGIVLVADDDGNAVSLGQDQQGQPAKNVTINVPVARFRGNEFEIAYNQAREACAQVLSQVQDNGNPAATSSSESPSKHSSAKAPAGNGRNAATRGTRDVDSRIEQLEK